MNVLIAEVDALTPLTRLMVQRAVEHQAGKGQRIGRKAPRPAAPALCRRRERRVLEVLRRGTIQRGALAIHYAGRRVHLCP